MKAPAVLMALLCFPVFAGEPKIKDVYGKMVAGCSVASDIDEGDADLLGPLEKDKLYVVFCYDSATFEGVACRVKQGGSTVDASSGEGSDGEGELLFKGEKVSVWVDDSHKYISFEPLADGTTQVGVACQRN